MRLTMERDGHTGAWVWRAVSNVRYGETYVGTGNTVIEALAHLVEVLENERETDG